MRRRAEYFDVPVKPDCPGHLRPARQRPVHQNRSVHLSATAGLAGPAVSGCRDLVLLPERSLTTTDSPDPQVLPELAAVIPFHYRAQHRPRFQFLLSDLQVPCEQSAQPADPDSTNLDSQELQWLPALRPVSFLAFLGWYRTVVVTIAARFLRPFRQALSPAQERVPDCLAAEPLCPADLHDRVRYEAKVPAPANFPLPSCPRPPVPEQSDPGVHSLNEPGHEDHAWLP